VITLLNPVPSQRARLLAQGDVHVAAQWTTAAGLSPDGEPDYPNEPAYVVLARVLLAQNDPGPALTLLQRLLDAGPIAVAALTCIVLYGGAKRAGLGRRRSALLAGAAAVVLGGWLIASVVIAGHGWYHMLPWFPVAVTGYLGLLLALRRIPVVARALAAPGMVSRLELPHTPRVAGVAFLLFIDALKRAA
jgi:hypothetical protein